MKLGWVMNSPMEKMIIPAKKRAGTMVMLSIMTPTTKVEMPSIMR